MFLQKFQFLCVGPCPFSVFVYGVRQRWKFFFIWLPSCSRTIVEKTSLSPLKYLSIFVKSIYCHICVDLFLDFLFCPTVLYFFLLCQYYQSLIISLDNKQCQFLICSLFQYCFGQSRFFVNFRISLLISAPQNLFGVIRYAFNLQLPADNWHIYNIESSDL